jgi:hypothetical protein
MISMVSKPEKEGSGLLLLRFYAQLFGIFAPHGKGRVGRLFSTF